MEASNIDSLHTCLSKLCLSIAIGCEYIKRSVILKLLYLLENVFSKCKIKNIILYNSFYKEFFVQVEFKRNILS